MKTIKGIFTLLFAMSLLQVSFATTIDKIIAFGDSMTDNGNIYKFTIETHKVIPLVPIIPKNPPYYEGRFTNGTNWIDNLATLMNVPLEDYAYGGSWAEPIKDSKINVPFGLDLQVAFYLVKSSFDFHKGRHLYVLWTGANDYIKGRSDPEYATTNAVNSIKTQIEWLIFYGAKNIYIMNVPDLGVVPQVAAQGRDYAVKITQLTEMHNRKLAKMIREVQQNHTDVNLILGETTQYFNDILINPSKYHLRNITDACYNGGYWLQNKFADSSEIQAAREAQLDVLNSPSLREVYLNSRLGSNDICNNPDEYLFWDHLHPTKAMHSIVSRLTLKTLQENNINS